MEEKMSKKKLIRKSQFSDTVTEPKKEITFKYGKGAPISVSPIMFDNDVKLIPQSIRNFFKNLAKPINKFANKEFQIPVNINLVNNTALQTWTAGQRLGNTYEEHYNKTNELLNNYGMGIHDVSIKPSQVASGMSLAGSAVAPYHPIVGCIMAAPDIVFDVAAAIDEPTPKNVDFAAANFGEPIAEILTPTFKWDDLIIKGVNFIGNGTDAVGLIE